MTPYFLCAQWDRISPFSEIRHTGIFRYRPAAPHLRQKQSWLAVDGMCLRRGPPRISVASPPHLPRSSASTAKQVPTARMPAGCRPKSFAEAACMMLLRVEMPLLHNQPWCLPETNSIWVLLVLVQTKTTTSGSDCEFRVVS